MGRRSRADRPPVERPLARWLDRLPLLAELASERGPVVVGCSGGADSLALLALASAAGVPVVAVHVDHGLRAGSEADFAVVASAAAGLGVSSITCRVTVEAGPNLEARARDARYEALEHARVSTGAAVVLVGHTADDQAETVLLNLLRGSATAGLAAMPARQGTVLRPLLGLRRRDTVEICARLGLAPVVDPMNGDSRFRRVWLRREVLPALEAGAGRDLRDLLARQAEVMRDESDLLDALARRALAEAGDPPRTDSIAALEPALARRALRQWLGGTPPSLATIDALLAVVAGERRALELPGGRRVVRRRGLLTLEPSTSPPLAAPVTRSRSRPGGKTIASSPPLAAPVTRSRSRPGGKTIASSPPLAAPVQFTLPGSVSAHGVDLETWIERAPPVAWPDGRETCVVDADAVGDRAWLRAAVAAERFAPLGLAGTKAVAAVSGDAQVVATAASGGVVWVVGYRIDDHARVTSRTRRFLWMTVSASVSPR